MFDEFIGDARRTAGFVVGRFFDYIHPYFKGDRIHKSGVPCGLHMILRRYCACHSSGMTVEVEGKSPVHDWKCLTVSFLTESGSVTKLPLTIIRSITIFFLDRSRTESIILD